MTGSTTINRQPAGRPEGGEFAERIKPGADVSLHLSDEEYNADGTYLFPPEPRSAEQHFAFWWRVPIPDEIMADVTEAYWRNREEKITEACEAAADAWKKENPDPTLPGMPRIKNKDYHYVVQGWKNGVRAVWDQTEAEEQQARPQSIPPTHMRSVLRAYNAIQYGKVLPEEEYVKVWEQELPWTGGETAKVEWLYHTYRLWEIDHATRTAMS